MSAKLISPAGQVIREVKNLGWLLRNWQDIKDFVFLYMPNKMVDGKLIANLKSGSRYETDYSSLSICFRWLDRPVFKGVKLTINNFDLGTVSSYTIGDENYKRIKNLDNKKDYIKIQNKEFGV